MQIGAEYTNLYLHRNFVKEANRVTNNNKQTNKEGEKKKMEETKISCPVCSTYFSSAVIESHVDKCLFLNDTTSDADCSRLPSNSSTPARRPDGSKRKHVMQQSSNSRQRCPTVMDSQESTDTGSKRLCTSLCVPLAERMRPTSLDRYVGQDHILGPQALFSQLLQRAEIPNIILWGPPGCGKTSLANVIAHICKSHENGKIRYVKLSAAMAGVSEVKEVISIAANELKFGRRTVTFMDEIHRFNKSQQDVFLPHVEAGTITLIGATTENPSFSLNSALLSRCRVIILEKLSVPSLTSILKRAVNSLNGIIHDSVTNELKLQSGECAANFIIDGATVDWLAGTCDGDARIALGGLELAVQSKIPAESDILQASPAVLITVDDVKESLKKSHMLYDRKGDQHYDMISALHKSVRASDDNASLYWLSRMIIGGEDPVYIARRLVRMACEDIGLEDPKALGIAVHTMHGCKMIGTPECNILLAQCTTYLARAPKSRLMEDALRAAQKTVTEHKGSQPGVPLHLRNAPTELMKTLGYGMGYNMMNKDESGLNYLPEGLEDVNFFHEAENDSSL